jgi:hypothetical protein
MDAGMTQAISRLATACVLLLAVPAGTAAAAAATTGVEVSGLSLELTLPPGYCALSREQAADRTALDRQAQRYAPTGAKLLVLGAPCAKLAAWRGGGTIITEWVFWLNQTANGVPVEYRGPRDRFLDRTEAAADSAIEKQAAERKANTAPLPAVHNVTVDSQKLKRSTDGVYTMRRQRTVQPDGKKFETVFVLGHTLVAERALRFEMEARVDGKVSAESLLKQVEPIVSKAVAANAKRLPDRGLQGEQREKFTSGAVSSCRGDSRTLPALTQEQRDAMCRCVADTVADRLSPAELAPEAAKPDLAARMQAIARDAGLECAIAQRASAPR